MTAKSKRLFGLWPGLLMLLAPWAASAQSEAYEWLEGMNRALHTLDYEGRFVYRHGETMEAMYLAHTVRDGNEREHLVSLTGNAREVIRDNTAVICIVPGNRTAKVDKRPVGRRFAPILRISPEQLARFYELELGGTERVAGRQARVVIIRPADELRYGYRLLLDQEHRLPLGAATFDKDGQRITQLLFTELKVGEEVTALPPSLTSEGEVTRTVRPRVPPEYRLTPRWSFDDIPPGFELTLHRRRLVGNDEHEMEHFVFSDGLASVSVYVEENGEDGGLAGFARMGAVNAYGRHLNTYHATAVGEVPGETLARLVAGIRRESGAP
jgi:sigma-E factor negative regulatory protein RseB